MPSLSEGGGSLLCRAQVRRRELCLVSEPLIMGCYMGSPETRSRPLTPFRSRSWGRDGGVQGDLLESELFQQLRMGNSPSKK